MIIMKLQQQYNTLSQEQEDSSILSANYDLAADAVKKCVILHCIIFIGL